MLIDHPSDNFRTLYNSRVELYASALCNVHTFTSVSFLTRLSLTTLARFTNMNLFVCYRQESLVKGQVDIQSNDESAFTNPFWAKKQAKLLESKQWHEPLENCIQLAYSLWIDPNDDACSVLNCVEANKEPTDDTEAPDDFTMFSQSLRVLYRS